MTPAESADNKSRIIYGPISRLPIVFHYKGGGKKGSSETIVTTAMTPELMLEPFSMRGFLSPTGN